MGKANDDQWNQIWDDYGSDSRRWSLNNFMKKFRFLETVPRNARILDLGCGNGILLGILKSHGYTNLKGLEPEKRLFSRDNLGGIIKSGDCLTVASKKGEKARYDAVIMVGVLHHLKDYASMQRCFRNVHAILKPGGAFYSLEPWKNIIRSIIMKLVRDTFVGHFFMSAERGMLKLEEKELGQWLELEKQVTAYAPQAGLSVESQIKDVRYRYIVFRKAKR